MIKTLLFFEILIFVSTNKINGTENCYSNIEKAENFRQNFLGQNETGDILIDAANMFKQELLNFVFSLYDFEGQFLDGQLYDIIEGLDQECWNFIMKFFFDEKDFMNDITKKLIHDGGLIQYSMSAEEDCKNEDGVYLLFTGIYNRSELKNANTYSGQEALFREANYVRQEVCAFKECKNTYRKLFSYLLYFKKNEIKGLFKWNNIELTEIQYKNIEDIAQIPYKPEQYEIVKNKEKYLGIIQYVILSLFLLIFILSIVSFVLRQREAKKEEKIRKQNRNQSNKKNQLHKTDSKILKIISCFDIFNNFSILNKIEEPLSNQNNLTALGAMKLIVLFYIMLGENTFIILKYVENKMSLSPFLKNYFFGLIKIGMNSYESYKVLCGAVFGFKFISFYYKHENDSKCKKTVLFLTKIIPYIIIFCIIHFFLNYPIFIYAEQIYKISRNSYMTRIMEKCPCQNEGPFTIFNIITIMGNYNSTEFNIGQYNGCYRPILFAYSEIFTFFVVLIFALVNILCKNYSKTNLIFSIIFFLNFIYMGLTLMITREVNDLIGEYTISRLFGLSGEIALPHMFFPLYYLGFNIGIIYYYRKNIQKKTKIIPFEYCDWIANSFLPKFSGKVKYIFMFIFFILMMVLSLSFSFLINSIKEDDVLFTFEKMKIAKYVFIYEGILHGLFFSFFLLFYLCLDDDSFIRSILSSEFFTFVNKISFVLFITLISVLNFFHSIGMMEIYLFTFSLYANTLILFIISCILAIVITCIFLFPIKWIYLYVSEGFHTEKIKQKL